MGAGGKGGGGGKAHDYFGTIAGLICAGPVDSVLGIVSDGKTVWPEADGEWSAGTSYEAGVMIHKSSRAWTCTLDHTADEFNTPGLTGAPWESYALNRLDPGVSNPTVISVPGYGVAILYWGTDDQTHGPDVPEISATHPPYRRQCWVILKDWLFGRERVSAPNVEFLVKRKARQTAITGPAAELDAEGQSGLLAFGAELMSDPVFGAGRPDLVSNWQGAADAAAGRPDLWNLSPCIRKAESFRGFGEAMADYLDGYWRADGAGRITAGRFPTSEAPPTFPASLTIDENSLIEGEPISFATKPNTVTEATVRFSDRSRSFKARNAKATDTLSRGFQDATAKTLDRPWITRPGQAAFHAADFLRRNSEPVISGTAVCRREAVAEIEVGTVFLLKDAASGLSLPCRCEGKRLSEPPSARATLEFSSEPNFTPLVTLEGADGVTPAVPPEPETVNLFQLVQPPPAMVGGDKFALMVLAARTSRVSTGLRLHLQESDPTLFYDLGVQGNWAIAGTLESDYASTIPGTSSGDDNSEWLRVNLDPSTVPSDKAALGETQSADAVNDANLLVWVFKAEDPKAFEVMTIRAARVAYGEGFYRLKVRRSRFGTLRLSFATGDRCWIIRRRNLVSYTHQRFAALSVSETPAVFRLQSFNPWKTADIANPVACPDRPFTFADPYAPRVTWTSFEQKPPGGAWATVTTFAVDYPLATEFRVAMTLRDSNADLLSASLNAIGPGDASASLFGSGAAGSEALVSATFNLDEGDWNLVALIGDRTRRFTDSALPDIGGTTPATVRVRDVGSLIVANPVASPRGGWFEFDQTVTLTTTTAGASIEFQVVGLNLPAGGSWTAYTAPVTVSPDQTLYARAVKAGMTTSPTVRHSFYYRDPDEVG